MKKVRRRLNDNEASYLNLTIKKPEKDRRNPRYYITNEQYKEILYNRSLPKERQFVETQIKKGKNGEVISTLEKLQSEPIDIPENFEVVKISTSKTTGQQWIQYKPKEVENPVNDFSKEFIEKCIKKHIKPVKHTFKK